MRERTHDLRQLIDGQRAKVLAAVAAGDRELAATLHLLAAPSLGRRAARHIDVDGRGIDFEAMLAEPWSAGERVLIEVACSLWGRPDIADGRVTDLLYRIDRDNYERVLAAMQMRRGDA